MRKKPPADSIKKTYLSVNTTHIHIETDWNAIEPENCCAATVADLATTISKSMRRRKRRDANIKRLFKGERTKKFNHPFEVQATVAKSFGGSPRRGILRSRAVAYQIDTVRSTLRSLNITFDLHTNSRRRLKKISSKLYSRRGVVRRITKVKMVYFESYGDYLIANLTVPELFASVRVKP